MRRSSVHETAPDGTVDAAARRAVRVGVSGRPLNPTVRAVGVGPDLRRSRWRRSASLGERKPVAERGVARPEWRRHPVPTFVSGSHDLGSEDLRQRLLVGSDELADGSFDRSSRARTLGEPMISVALGPRAQRRENHGRPGAAPGGARRRPPPPSRPVRPAREPPQHVAPRPVGMSLASAELPLPQAERHSAAIERPAHKRRCPLRPLPRRIRSMEPEPGSSNQSYRIGIPLIGCWLSAPQP